MRQWHQQDAGQHQYNMPQKNQQQGYVDRDCFIPYPGLGYDHQYCESPGGNYQG